jgi:membrane-associated protease RseP (regulator of RpoE activity)
MALGALSLAVQGCTSAGVSVNQTLRVETPGCGTATCELYNDRGRWHVGATPGTVTLTTSDSPLQVSCRAANGAQSAAGASSLSRRLTGSGAVIGAAAGGAAVGATFGTVALAFIPVIGFTVLATGVAAGAVAGQSFESNARDLTYPELIAVPMNCPESGESPRGVAAEAALGLEVRGLSRAESLAAGFGDRGAVMVIAVTPESRAAAAGLQTGDVILRAAEQDLRDATDLEDLVRAPAAEAMLALKIWRDGRTMDLVLVKRRGTP